MNLNIIKIKVHFKKFTQNSIKFNKFLKFDYIIHFIFIFYVIGRGLPERYQFRTVLAGARTSADPLRPEILLEIFSK